MTEILVRTTGIALEGVTKRYGRRTALDGIDLDLGPGVFGLLGPNGAGKTTLLKIMATVMSPTSGDVRLLGLNPRSGSDVRQIRRRLGYLPQAFGYYPNFTVFEFVEYFALLKEMEPRAVRQAVSEAIHRVGLEDRATSRLKSLSGGMIRRVGIAQAIVNQPSLLVLDEPTSGLDPEQRVRFRHLVRDLAQTATVILSTHLVEDVAGTCAALAVMRDGRVRFQGAPDALAAIGTADTTPHEAGESSLERGYRLVLAGQEVAR